MLQVETLAVTDLIPFARNSRTHPDSQVAQIASSIREFGFTNPILIDEHNGIIAGHGRLLAARKLNLTEVPCIRLIGLTDTQKRAYVIADNKIALNAGWDEKLLSLELKELGEFGVKTDSVGFSDSEIKALSLKDINLQREEPYTRKIEAPKYEPTGDKPSLDSLCDREKTNKLIKDIKSSGLSDDEKKFLFFAAERHTVFDFRKVADYYAHASSEMQSLMEDSALVIIDFDKAIENGYILLTKNIMEQYKKDTADDDEE
jgi:hypothetical protein